MDIYTIMRIVWNMAEEQQGINDTLYHNYVCWWIDLDKIRWEMA